MKAKLSILLLTSAVLAAPAVSAQRLYRWVDEHGNVHYGDRIPPQYADRDRAVLNTQGVAVRTEEGALSDAERAERERERRAEAEAQEARAETARRDRMLLETYLGVEDIESLRDSRLEMLESQITVTEIYLANLNERLKKLHADASRYKPYSDREEAPELPQDLARELSITEASISSYEETIERTRAEQAKLKSQFDGDIARFRELKGG